VELELEQAKLVHAMLKTIAMVSIYIANFFIVDSPSNAKCVVVSLNLGGTFMLDAANYS
jgi:hypothetical protein